MSTASSCSRVDNQNLCYCSLPTIMRTSKTADNPGRIFRVCPNKHRKGKKCEYWEWVDDSEDENEHGKKGEAVKEKKYITSLKYNAKKETAEKEVLDEVAAGKKEVLAQVHDLKKMLSSIRLMLFAVIGLLIWKIMI